MTPHPASDLILTNHFTVTQQISAITSGGCLMQAILITFIGWAAKTLVNNRTFGLSQTKWRKIFQGASNFGMASIYFVLPLLNPSLELVAFLIMFVFLAWMLGAGGESMVPYDLSYRYPATIFGFGHSIGVLSGLFVPWVSSLILGEESTNFERWNNLFWLIGGLLTLGVLVFALFLKSKPFLPGEKAAKLESGPRAAVVGK